MPIDTSMYNNIQQPDFAAAADRGMRMGDLIEQRRTKGAVRNAYKNAMTTAPDGSLQVNEGMLMKDLYSNAGPEAAMEAQEKFARQKQQKAQGTSADLDLALKKIRNAGEYLSTATDEQSWAAGRQRVIEDGLMKAEQIPEQYDPKQKDFFAGLMLSGAERLELERKNMRATKDDSFRERELASRNKGSSEYGLKPTKAQEVVDSEFGKEYSAWTSGGRDGALTEIGKLRGVAQDLKKGKVTTGGMTGAFPDRLTSNEVLKARADVQSTIMNSLRAILGAAFTEKEGERVIKNTWNESDSTANNFARVERLVNDLEAKAIAKDAKAQFYEDRGTLREFKSQSIAGRGRQPVMTPGNRSIEVLPSANAGQGQVFKTNQIEWAD